MELSFSEIGGMPSMSIHESDETRLDVVKKSVQVFSGD